MTVFKTFWNVVKKYRGTIILYTVLLIIFGGLNMSTSENSTNFTNSKPNVYIINHDKNKGLTKNLITYMKKNTHIVSIKNDEKSIRDALFYRDINYIIEIPKNYQDDVLHKKNPEIKIQSTNDYQASLAEMILSKYIKIQNIYVKNIDDEEQMIKQINQTLSKKVEIHLTSKLDTNKASKASFYFNFASYSIMAVVIFIICLVLSSFHERMIYKRTMISSMNYKKYNYQLLKASFIYAMIVWFLFMILGIILLGNIMFSNRGFIYMINCLVFTFCSLTIAMFISTLVNNKNTINGIVNVVALGSSFLCGAFVPSEWLPDSVVKFSHILPSYWYIHSNNLLSSLEIIDEKTIQPILINIIVMLLFSIFFILINHVISKKKIKQNEA